MKKPNFEKLIFTFSLIFFLIIVYLIISPKNSKQAPMLGQELLAPAVNLEELENNYREKMKMVYSDIENLNLEDKIPEQEVDKIKDTLYKLKVPATLRDFHMETVFLLDKIKSMTIDDVWKSRELPGTLKEIKENNTWLN